MKNTKKLVLSALFLAIGLILPFITMQIPAVGKMLCPMHIPVLLCGFIVGWPYGLLVGFITPLLRSVLFGMPMLVPNAVCMAFELATYGFVAGVLSQKNAQRHEVSLHCACSSHAGGKSCVGTCLSNRVYTYGSWIYMETFLHGWICKCNSRNPHSVNTDSIAGEPPVCSRCYGCSL